MTYGVLLFLIYLVYTIERDKREEENFFRNLEQKEHSGSAVSSFSAQVDPAAMVLAASKLEFVDVKPGEGLPVLCGEEVTVAYEAYLPSGDAFDKAGVEAPQKIRVGRGDMVPGLELGLLGMRKNGLRKIMIPAYLGYDGVRFSHPKVPEATSIGMQMYILDKEFNTETAVLPLKIYEDKTGEGKRVLCGNTVTLHYALYDMGAKLLVAGSINKALPAVFSHVVLGMQPGGRRTAIIPAAYFNAQEIKKVFNVEIPEHQSLVAELEVEKHMPKKDDPKQTQERVNDVK